MAKKLSMYRGDYRQFTATVGNSLDAGAKLYFAVKPKADVNVVDLTDALAIFTVNCSNVNAVDNGNNTTTYTVTILPSATAGKTPGIYTGEIEYIDGTGKPTTYPQFDFELLGDVNQRS